MTKDADTGAASQRHRSTIRIEWPGADYVVFDAKGNSPTALSLRHHEEAWRTLVIIKEKLVDLENETVR